MRAVRQANTGPELAVRKILHKLGLRYRLHRRDLPGTPDIVLPKHRTVVFVHGCFWHRHEDCSKASTPKTREQFWREKFDRNIARDREIEDALIKLGWRVLTVWECEIKQAGVLTDRLSDAFPSAKR